MADTDEITDEVPYEIESVEDLIETHRELITAKERREFETRILGEMIWRVLAEVDTADPGAILDLKKDDIGDELGKRVVSRLFAETLLLKDKNSQLREKQE